MSGESKRSGNEIAAKKKRAERLVERRKERQKKSLNTSKKYDLINKISEALDNIVNKMTNKVGYSKSFNIDTNDLVELYKKTIDYSPFIDGEDKSRLSDDELDKVKIYKEKITLDKKDTKGDIENNFLLRTIIKDTNYILNIKTNDKKFDESIEKFEKKIYNFNEKYMVKREKEERDLEARKQREREEATAEEARKTEEGRKKTAAETAEKEKEDTEEKKNNQKYATDLFKRIKKYNLNLQGKKLEIKKLKPREIRNIIRNDIQIHNKEKKLPFEGNTLKYLNNIKVKIETADNDNLNIYFSKNIFSELEIFKKRIKDFYKEILGLDDGAKQAIYTKKASIDNDYKLFTYYANIEKIKIFKENNNYFDNISSEYLDRENKVVKFKDNKNIDEEINTTTNLVIKGYMHYLGSILYKMKLIRTLKWDKEDIFGISFLKSVQHDTDIMNANKEEGKGKGERKSGSGSESETKTITLGGGAKIRNRRTRGILKSAKRKEEQKQQQDNQDNLKKERDSKLDELAPKTTVEVTKKTNKTIKKKIKEIINEIKINIETQKKNTNKINKESLEMTIEITSQDERMLYNYFLRLDSNLDALKAFYMKDRKDETKEIVNKTNEIKKLMLKLKNKLGVTDEIIKKYNEKHVQEGNTKKIIKKANTFIANELQYDNDKDLSFEHKRIMKVRRILIIINALEDDYKTSEPWKPITNVDNHTKLSKHYEKYKWFLKLKKYYERILELLKDLKETSINDEITNINDHEYDFSLEKEEIENNMKFKLEYDVENIEKIKNLYNLYNKPLPDTEKIVKEKIKTFLENIAEKNILEKIAENMNTPKEYISPDDDETVTALNKYDDFKKEIDIMTPRLNNSVNKLEEYITLYLNPVATTAASQKTPGTEAEAEATADPMLRDDDSDIEI